MSKIILIGGIPTAGKTTLAKQIAKTYDYEYLGTDTLTRAMIAHMTPRQRLKLYGKTSHTTALDFYNNNSPKKLFKLCKKSSELIIISLKEIIRAAIRNNTSIVIEGVDLFPEFIAEITEEFHPYVIGMIVTDKNIKRTKNVLLTRGLFHVQGKKLKEHYASELEYIDMIRKHFQNIALHYNIPEIKLEKSKHDFAKVIKLIETY